jgi:hypothetical protein
LSNSTVWMRTFKSSSLISFDTIISSSSLNSLNLSSMRLFMLSSFGRVSLVDSSLSQSLIL